MSTKSLREQIEELDNGEKLTFNRQTFHGSVDEEDRVIYLAVTRKIAEELKCKIHVDEENLIFIKNS
jgi:hypothetical protein